MLIQRAASDEVILTEEGILFIANSDGVFFERTDECMMNEHVLYCMNRTVMMLIVTTRKKTLYSPRAEHSPPALVPSHMQELPLAYFVTSRPVGLAEAGRANTVFDAPSGYYCGSTIGKAVLPNA